MDETHAASSLSTELVKQVPQLVALIVLVWVFLRSIDKLAGRFEESLKADRELCTKVHGEVREDLGKIHDRLTAIQTQTAAGAGCRAPGGSVRPTPV